VLFEEMSRKGGMEGIALGLLSVLICQYVRLRRKKLKYQDAYWAERRGRARVEKEMKKIANIRLSKDEGFFVQPVGYISSCYRQCVGTPRQGMLVPHSRSSITLAKNVSPEALDGLEDFSHVWITFQFHLNSNTLKEANAFSKRATFQAKINPPMLKGIKLGVLATRSPHRPNPIGVTLAQIRGIDKKSRTLLLHACDLVDGTPVLDIKVNLFPVI
jgi:tRNA-Thr(GGU) m(6)t(6)A37 methyltransferase TsaA